MSLFLDSEGRQYLVSRQSISINPSAPRRTGRDVHFPTPSFPPLFPLSSNTSSASTVASTCTALTVYNKCASCPGAAPNPPSSVWQLSTKSIVSSRGKASGLPSRCSAVNPQYKPFSRRCSVSQYSISSLRCEQLVIEQTTGGGQEIRCRGFGYILHAAQ